MTPQEAGLALRDDPTFAAMSDAERQIEAGLILGTDDPLDIAVAIETALAEPAIMAQPITLAFEECRLPAPCGGREKVAGNGRCMTCGANRLSEATNAPERTEALPVASSGPVLSERDRLQVAWAKRLADIATNPPAMAQPFLARRVQQALGLKYHELGNLLGVSRPTAQAYVSGRLAEQVEGVRGEYLLRALNQRGEAIEALRAELRARLGK